MLSYLHHYWSAKTKYQVHSPFVYTFLTEVLEDDRLYYAFKLIQRIAKNTSTPLSAYRSISGKIIFRSVLLYRPSHILHISEGYNIAALYHAGPDPSCKVTCLRMGNNEAKGIKYFGNIPYFENITFEEDKTGKKWKNLLKAEKKTDWLFFQHHRDPALAIPLFDQWVKEAPQNAIFVYDQPYRSGKSKSIWKQLAQNKKISLSIDLYNLGFLFKRNEQKVKAHYPLVTSRQKPYAIF